MPSRLLTCIGQDREVEIVTAWDHAQALFELEEARESAAALEALVSKLAHTTPRSDAWKETYLALQKEARGLLSAKP